MHTNPAPIPVYRMNIEDSGIQPLRRVGLLCGDSTGVSDFRDPGLTWSVNTVYFVNAVCERGWNEFCKIT
jgi:hypothetical protein